MRVEEAGIWVVAAIGVVGLVGAAVIGFDISELVILALLGVVALVISGLITTDRDQHWLPAVVVAGFMTKMLGAGLRYYVYSAVYLGQGDAGRYHSFGLQLADVWRAFDVPSFEGARGSGTRVLEVITGLIYAPYKPQMLGGFLIFAMLGFLGQLLFYAAFRRAVPDGRLKIYAALVLFLPALAFWPSSIGKEAVMLPLIGLATYSGVRLLERYELRWVLAVAVGVGGSAAIRPHMGVLIAGALAGTMLFARAPDGMAARARRWVLIALTGLGLVLAIGLSAEQFGLDTTDPEIDPFLDELARRTGQGGSAVEGEAITTIADVPQGVLRVLFRPLIFEAFNPLSLASGVEGTVLLLLILWKLPRMITNIRSLRRRPYLIFCLLYSIGFVVAFSSILNLGILARQRTQVLPLLLALVVALGWPSVREDPGPEVPESSVPRLATG